MEFSYGLLHILYEWHIFNILKGERLLENLKGGHLFYKGWALRKKPLVNVLGVATYLINVRTGAYLITLNWIDAYTKMTCSYISSHV